MSFKFQTNNYISNNNINNNNNNKNLSSISLKIPKKKIELCESLDEREKYDYLGDLYSMYYFF
jgi:hypothetical protein